MSPNSAIVEPVKHEYSIAEPATVNSANVTPEIINPVSDKPATADPANPENATGAEITIKFEMILKNTVKGSKLHETLINLISSEISTDFANRNSIYFSAHTFN